MARKSKPFDDSCSSKWNVMEIDEFYQKDFPIEQLRKAIPHRAITKGIPTQSDYQEHFNTEFREMFKII